MRIIEKNILGKNNQETCEDGIIVTDYFAAVIDGSTSKTPHQFLPDMKNGRYCMKLIKSFIRIFPADGTCEDFCKGITSFIHNVYKEYHIDLNHLQKHPEERLTASAVIYSEKKKEVWMIGDCQCLIDKLHYTNNKPYEDRVASKRAYLISRGMSPSKAREAIVPDLIRAMEEGQNKQYAVIDGFDIYMQDVLVINVSHAQQLILASDGYPFLKENLYQSELLLDNQLKKDPQNIHAFKATKGLIKNNISFDDRSYLKIDIE